MTTLVAVQCWAGDAQRVRDQLNLYTHHGHPVLVLSPEDAPVEMDGVTCRTAGLNVYADGHPGGFERYRLQLEAALEYPWDHMLLHESDSICLSPEIPAILYEEEAIWANYVDLWWYLELKNEPNIEDAYARHNPAMQAPLFFSRRALGAMLEDWNTGVKSLPSYGDICFLFHTLSHLTGIRHRSYKELGISHHADDRMMSAIRKGAVMVHAVKNHDELKRALHAYGGDA